MAVRGYLKDGQNGLIEKATEVRTRAYYRDETEPKGIAFEFTSGTGADASIHARFVTDQVIGYTFEETEGA